MKEIVRIKVGRSPHGITFSPDSKTLFVAHERDPLIMRFEVGTWKPLTPLLVGVPQHVLHHRDEAAEHPAVHRDELPGAG